jgi:hypothetical protein
VVRLERGSPPDVAQEHIELAIICAAAKAYPWDPDTIATAVEAGVRELLEEGYLRDLIDRAARASAPGAALQSADASVQLPPSANG